MIFPPMPTPIFAGDDAYTAIIPHKKFINDHRMALGVAACAGLLTTASAARGVRAESHQDLRHVYRAMGIVVEGTKPIPLEAAR